MEVSVEAPVGQVIGYVRQEYVIHSCLIQTSSSSSSSSTNFIATASLKENFRAADNTEFVNLDIL